MYNLHNYPTTKDSLLHLPSSKINDEKMMTNKYTVNDLIWNYLLLYILLIKLKCHFSAQRLLSHLYLEPQPKFKKYL